jgi:uracil-DNA glycosylase family 4
MNAKAKGADCANCPLAQRPLVPSKIKPGAPILVIGEAPGAQEVFERAPFVGPAGRVLDYALHYIGLDPVNDVSKTNAVLCRPVNNAEPPIEALIACSGRLRIAIEAAGAQKIVTLGKYGTFALDKLAGRVDSRNVLARAGDVQQYGDTPYTATIHPAYVLRNEEAMLKLIRDLEHTVRPRPVFDPSRVRFDVMALDNADSLLAYLASFPDDSPLAFDVETDDLQWFDTPARPAAPLLCLVLNFEDYRSVIIPADLLVHDDIARGVWRTLVRSKVIAHNGKFDQDVVHARLGWDIELYDDTMLAHYALVEIGTHGLKQLAADYLGAPDYEGELIDSWFEDHKIAPARRKYSLLPRERLYMYAAYDGCVTLQLWRIFDAELRAKGLYEYPYRKVLIEALAYAIPKIEQNGIGIDVAQLEAFGVALQAELDQHTQAMRDYIATIVPGETFTPRPAKEGGKPKPIHTSAFKPSSPFHVSAILYDVLGLKLNKELIKPSKTNSGKEALEALPDHEFVNMLRSYRKVAKMYDMYVTSLTERATTEGLIHVDFKITGTEIGRLSAKNGDHGVPRPTNFYGAAIRSAFRAQPDSDEVLVIADYSQAELRAFALLADVPFLLAKYRNGEDVHTETAIMLEKLGAPLFEGFADAYAAVDAGNGDGLILLDMITGGHITAKEFVKDRRTFAKNVNFGNIYQGGAQGIAGMIGGVLPVPAVQEILDVYAQLMPEAKAYARSQFALLKRQGFVTTPFNRHRRFYVLTDQNLDDARKAVVHMVVASTAADLNNLAAARLVRAGVRVCHLVHDSIIARASRDEAPDVHKLMQQTMIDVGAEYMPGVPWVVDIDQEKDGSYPTRWADVPHEELARRSLAHRNDDLAQRLIDKHTKRLASRQPLPKSLKLIENV